LEWVPIQYQLSSWCRQRKENLDLLLLLGTLREFWVCETLTLTSSIFKLLCLHLYNMRKPSLRGAKSLQGLWQSPVLSVPSTHFLPSTPRCPTRITLSSDLAVPSPRAGHHFQIPFWKPRAIGRHTQLMRAASQSCQALCSATSLLACSPSSLLLAHLMGVETEAERRSIAGSSLQG
jgi:hypothetical protein